MIEIRLSKLSKNKDTFDNIKGTYQNALDKSNFIYKLKYRRTDNPNNKKKNRKRKCIFYNPPFCKSVETNIGKLFLALLDKHFNKSSEYHKIINRNCIKISYCCSPNILALINGHNKRLLNSTEENVNLCNCRSKNKCPVQNKCCLSRVIYQTNIKTSNNISKMYIGSTKRKFKIRYNEHKASFPKENKNKPKNCTQLANYLWMLKENNISYTMEWKIIDSVKMNNNHINMCKLCNLERFYIAKADKRKILNKRNELITQCPHYLSNLL